MLKFKVVLGLRKYTTEMVVYVSASTTEEACCIAMHNNRGMRYALARLVRE